MMTTKECNCALLGTPSWHARDNVHHVTNVWHCPVHGKQSKTTLIHKEKQAGCVPCNKEPEAGWDSTMEINTLATKLQSDNYSRSEIARRLLVLVEQVREEATIKERTKISAELSIRDAKIKKIGHLQALSRLEEEVDGKMRVMPDHKCFSEGYCDHYPVTDIRNRALTDIQAIISKIREEYGTN